MRPRVVILKMGSAHPDVVAQRGDYEDWFVRALESHPRRRAFDILVRPAWADGDIDARCILMTGSRQSVYDPLSWIPPAMDRLQRAIDAGATILGVCFGHQLLATLFGGSVVRNPLGLTMGTKVVELTETGRQDPLFQGVPNRFAVEETHGDVVTVVPPGARRLVTSPHDPNHAFRLAESVWSVQFHPEMGEQEARAVRASHGDSGGPSLRPSPQAQSVDRFPRAGTRILHQLVDIALF